MTAPGFRIGGVWAFLAVGDDGDEGVIGMATADGWLPLVAADEARLADLRPVAEATARSTGRPVVLAPFDRRVDLERFGE